jgi:hypothetical protein
MGESYSVESGWKVDDPKIAELHKQQVLNTSDIVLLNGMPSMYLLGRQAGTTIVSIAGLHLTSDTMASSNPIPSSLQREVRVLPRISRIEIAPRPNTVRVGDSVVFRARVIDASGDELRGLMIDWRIVAKTYSETGEQSSGRTVYFDSTGSRTIIARAGNRTDSLTVVVIGRRKR